jgi:hypothetical protein
VLKIRRSEDPLPAVFALSGRIEETQVPELEKLIEAEAELAAITLDLKEVRIVDPANRPVSGGLRSSGYQAKVLSTLYPRMDTNKERHNP